MLLTIEVIREGAFSLLSDMERLDLIRVKSPIKNNTESGDKLSLKFAGALRLSDAVYETYQSALSEGRNEWRKDIY